MNADMNDDLIRQVRRCHYPGSPWCLDCKGHRRCVSADMADALEEMTTRYIGHVSGERCDVAAIRAAYERDAVGDHE